MYLFLGIFQGTFVLSAMISAILLLHFMKSHRWGQDYRLYECRLSITTTTSLFSAEADPGGGLRGVVTPAFGKFSDLFGYPYKFQSNRSLQEDWSYSSSWLLNYPNARSIFWRRSPRLPSALSRAIDYSKYCSWIGWSKRHVVLGERHSISQILWKWGT